MTNKFKCGILAGAAIIVALIPGKVNAQIKEKSSSNTAVLALDPGVRYGKLANGFTYYIRHNQEPKNRVTMYLATKAGSILETDDQQGLAHFMEHMSFNGTTHYPKNELISYLQKSGVRFGADINAYTSFDETVYQLPLPTDDPELLKNGLQILRDWAANATLDPEEINKERGVVLEEKRLGKGADERMRRVYYPIILNGAKYAYRIPIGKEDIIKNFSRTTIERFYRDWYRPDLQALIVVGDINVSDMEKAIKAKFSDLKNPVQEKKRSKYSIPLSGQNHFIAVTDKEKSATEIEILMKQAGQSLRNEADYRQQIKISLLNQMTSFRFSELNHKQDISFISSSARLEDFLAGLKTYTVSVTLKPGQYETGFKTVWREVERIKQQGFTESEFERAKKAYLNQLEGAYKEKDKIASATYVREYLQNFLNGTAAPGLEKEHNMVKELLPAISLDEVNQFAKSCIREHDRDILVLASEQEKKNLPNEATLLNWMKDVSRETISPYQDNIRQQDLVTTVNIPGKISKETTDRTLGMITITLNNGARVILKPTTNKANQIMFTAFAPGGTSLYNDADYESASAANVIPLCGVGAFSSVELQKYLSGKQVRVQPYINERTEGLNGGAANQDLETAMQLIYAYFTNPRRDSAAFANVIARTRFGIENRQNDPNSVFQDTINAVLGNHNIRRTAPSLAKLQQVNFDRSLGIYKERFADASNFTFVFVGSIDTAVIKPLLEKYIGSLPALNKHEQARDLGITVPGGRMEKVVYKGTEAKATVNIVYSGLYDYSVENKMKLDALKEIIQLRLLERLREEESGVYTPKAMLNTSKYPQPRFSLVISFGCAPENVDKLIASAEDEINKLRTSDPSAEDLEKYKSESKRSIETMMQNNAFWLGYINGQLQNQEDLEQINDYGKQTSQIEGADIKEVAQKYITGKNCIKFILLPEQKRLN